MPLLTLKYWDNTPPQQCALESLDAFQNVYLEEVLVLLLVLATNLLSILPRLRVHKVQRTELPLLEMRKNRFPPRMVSTTDDVSAVVDGTRGVVR